MKTLLLAMAFLGALQEKPEPPSYAATVKIDDV